MNASATAPLSAKFQRISAAEAAALLRRPEGAPRPVLFDVRDRASYERAHVSGAEHLTDAHLGAALRRVPKSAAVMIYCYHGNASQVYAETFADFRFAEVYSVDGGYEPLAAALALLDGVRSAPRLPDGASADLRAFVLRHAFDPADLDAPRAQGLTPLMRAALQGQAELVGELLAAGVEVDRRNGDGNNALWLACVSRDVATVAALVAAGIDLDNRNDMGATCLMYAASSGRPTMVEALLKAGADPYVRNFDDARAVDLCATLECLRLLRHTGN